MTTIANSCLCYSINWIVHRWSCEKMLTTSDRISLLRKSSCIHDTLLQKFQVNSVCLPYALLLKRRLCRLFQHFLVILKRLKEAGEKHVFSPALQKGKEDARSSSIDDRLIGQRQEIFADCCIVRIGAHDLKRKVAIKCSCGSATHVVPNAPGQKKEPTLGPSPVRLVLTPMP
jgi:hypothetical protein